LVVAILKKILTHTKYIILEHMFRSKIISLHFLNALARSTYSCYNQVSYDSHPISSLLTSVLYLVPSEVMHSLTVLENVLSLGNSFNINAI